MAGEWQTTTLANAPLAIIDGDRGTNYPNQAEFSASGDCLFLNAGNVTTNGFNFSDCAFVTAEKDAALRKGKLIRNDVVLTTRGTVGNSAYFNEAVQFDKIRINSGMVILRAQAPALQPRYLYLFVRSALFHAQVSALRTGSAQPQLPIRDINRIKIPIPPPEEQRAIAHILGMLDDKIELNRRINETLETMARAIFKSWFVDTTESRIPKGWRIAKLPEVVEINPPRQISKGQIAPYLDMQNMPTHGHRPVDWINRPFGSGMRFKNGDTLVARITPCLENGKTAFVDFLEDYQVGWGSTEYIVVRPKKPLPVEYGYYLARSENFRNHAIQNMTGTSGRQRVPAECFSKYQIAVPSEAVAQRFGELVKPLMEAIRANDNQSRTLAAIRDTLLPRLISGKIRVPI